jgi:hypothetical protein
MADTPVQLLRDLEVVGVHVGDLWELVNSKVQYPSAVPVLVEWLDNLDTRVPTVDRPHMLEGLVRALTIPAARPTAAPALMRLFRGSTCSPMLQWVVGNALGVVVDDSLFDDIECLVRDRRFGKARQMVVLGLGRSTDPRAIPLLIELLADEDVAAHAVRALGTLRAGAARASVERMLRHPQALVRREAKKALARLGS